MARLFEVSWVNAGPAPQVYIRFIMCIGKA